MQDTFITLGPLGKAKLGGSYMAHAQLVGARSLGSVTPVWTATGDVTEVPTNPPGNIATIPIPADGAQFQLTVTATLPGTPDITVSESQSIDLVP